MNLNESGYHVKDQQHFSTIQFDNDVFVWFVFIFFFATMCRVPYEFRLNNESGEQVMVEDLVYMASLLNLQAARQFDMIADEEMFDDSDTESETYEVEYDCDFCGQFSHPESAEACPYKEFQYVFIFASKESLFFNDMVIDGFYGCVPVWAFSCKNAERGYSMSLLVFKRNETPGFIVPEVLVVNVLYCIADIRCRMMDILCNDDLKEIGERPSFFSDVIFPPTITRFLNI